MIIIRLPRLGQTMEQGVLSLWCQPEGGAFSTGDVLYEVETEKMTTPVEAKQDGVLVRIITPVGDEIPVGAAIAVVAAPDEAVDDDILDAFLRENNVEARQEAIPRDETGSAAPPMLSVHPSMEGAPVAPFDSTRSPAGKDIGPAPAVPKARAIAKERGITLHDVHGTGVGGTVRVGDLDVYLRENSSTYRGSARISERVPVHGVMRSMADSVTRSWTEVPQFVQQVLADGSALKARMKRLRFEGYEVTYTDLLISAVAITAAEVSEVNASFLGDEIVRYGDVNVSFAVATERGLVVPVLRAADQRSLEDIAAETRSLADRAREGRLTQHDVSDGTITISNLGAFGVDTGTPLVNAPQSAIVFIGSLKDQPVAEDGRLVIRPMLNLSCAFDHRVIDGMTGARFTSALKNRIEAGG